MKWRPGMTESAVDLAAKKCYTLAEIILLDIRMPSPESARREQPPSDEMKESKPKFDLEALSSEIPEPAKVETETSPERLAEVREAVRQGVDLAYEILESDYENPSEDKKDQELKFHNRTHTEGVVNRTKKILEAVRPTPEGEQPSPETERLVELGRLIAAFHDVRNMSRTLEIPDANFNGTMNTRADGRPLTKKVRKRALMPGDFKMRDELRAKKISETELGGAPLSETEAGNLNSLEELGTLGTNELDSAKELLAYMDNQKDDEGQPLFNEQDRNDVLFALAATVPDWDVKMGTVKQINLNESSRELARAVALADLGEAGMDPDAYLVAGDALFLEDNPDIADAVEHPDKYDDEQKARFAQRITGFSQTQAGFALGRKNRLSQELEGLAPDQQERVRATFNRFDGENGEPEVELDENGKIKRLVTENPTGSIGRALQEGQSRVGMSFEQLSEKLRENAKKHKESFKGQE
jgi:hypothetical protein